MEDASKAPSHPPFLLPRGQAVNIVYHHADAFGGFKSASAQNISALYRKPRKQI